MSKRNRVAVAVALVLITAYAIRLINKTLSPEYALMADFIRSMLHIGLFTAWVFSLYRRVVQKQARKYLCGIAILMILWLNFKTLKYHIVPYDAVDRYLWYLYYLPLIFIPLYMLFAALFIGKTDDYRLPKMIKILHVPAVLLFLLVMTNDMHQLVFSFPMNDFSQNNYRHGVGYFLVFGWFVLCSLAAFYIMYSGYRAKRKYREFVPLLVSLALTITYFLTYLTGNKVTMFLAGDISTASSLLYASVMESCIYCGLLPTNSRYDEMFAASVGSSAQIVGTDYRTRYASSQAEPIPAEQIKAAMGGPISIDGGKLLHAVPISGGYAVWNEDVSELKELQKELTEVKDELERHTSMLKNEYAVEKERKIIEEQNRLYDLLTASTQKQINKIAELMKEYELSDGDTGKCNAILSRIAVLGSYVKRKKHLILSAQNGLTVREDELKNALDESARYLQAMNVRCTVFVDTERKFIPGNIAEKAYDFFEAAVEAALESLISVFVTVTAVSGELRARIIIRCKEDLSVLGEAITNASVSLSDEDEWELILPLNGGDAL